MWVNLTAESVLLTCWPPAPEALYVSVLISALLIFISIAGRIVLKRVMGNASFATLRDASGDIQIYVTKNNVDESIYDDFKTWDLGDIVGVSGSLFRTKTDANEVCLLLPESKVDFLTNLCIPVSVLNHP